MTGETLIRFGEFQWRKPLDTNKDGLNKVSKLGEHYELVVTVKTIRYYYNLNI